MPRQPMASHLLAAAMAITCPAAAVAAAAPGVTAFFGAWTITGSVPATWTGSGTAGDEAEARRLVGRHVTFNSRAILGPRPLACRGPQYGFKEYGADMLFQGTLTDPVPQARALGFARLPVRTLETGCEGLIDFHFVDARTAMFALNNRIYTLRHHR